MRSSIVLIGLVTLFVLLQTGANVWAQSDRAGLWVGTVLVDAVSEINKPISDLSFDLQVSGVLVDEPLVEAGVPWRFATGTDLGNSWRNAAFNDSGWSVGSAPLGYGQAVSTTIPFGGNPADKHPTAYFRTSFTVGDPALYSVLHLRFRRDDGVAIYLNGVQIVRDNLPSTFVNYSTLALTAIVDDPGTVSVNEETAFLEVQIPAVNLVAGSNVIAAEVHQVAVDDADLGFDLSLVAGLGSPSPQVLVPTLATGWRYSDAGDELPAVWKDLGYSEPGWLTGQAQLGFGDGDETTVVSSGPDPSTKNPVTYFRHQFSVAAPSSYSHIDLALLRDDGAVVYLNGQELFRSNMPGGTIAYLTSPVEGVASEDERRYFTTRVEAGALVAGTNVVAVEVHQHVAELSPFDGSAPPSPTASQLDLRILLHNDDSNQVSLLKDVIEMWKDGTLAADGTLDVPGRYVLVTDDSLIPGLKGVGNRDGSLVGRRVSAIGFDFPGRALVVRGSLAPGSTLRALVSIPADHPTHPFRHRYHPEHDNLDATYTGPAAEVRAISREIDIQLDDRYPPDPDQPIASPPPGWGITSLGGLYQETITGLHRDPIIIQGVVELTRVSDTAVLND